MFSRCRSTLCFGSFHHSALQAISMDNTTSFIPVNVPYVVAEVAAAVAAYDRAVADNDTFLLRSLVWQAPCAIRYGVDGERDASAETDELHAGSALDGAAIAARTTLITSFGHHYATVNTEFTYKNSDLRGRRTVVWAKVGPDSQPEAGLHGGWRIVASHDSVVFGNRAPGSTDR
jgi:hypothetical protein